MRQVRETVRDVTFLHNEQFFAAAQKKYVYIYDKRGLEVHCLKVGAMLLPSFGNFWLAMARGLYSMPMNTRLCHVKGQAVSLPHFNERNLMDVCRSTLAYDGWSSCPTTSC